MKRNREIDVARTLGNYFIIFGHASAAFQYCALQGKEFLFWEVLPRVTWILPSMFLMSGYLMACGWSAASMKGKFARRLKRLVVPYLAWNFLFVAFYLSLKGFVPRLAQRVAAFGLDSWSGVLSKTVSLVEAPIDGPLWFLRTLAVFTLFYPLFDFLLSKWKGLPAFALAAGYFVLANTVEAVKPVCAGCVYPPYALALFVFGAWCSKRGTDLAETFSKPWCIGLWMVYIACSVAGKGFGVAFSPGLAGLVPVAGFPALFILSKALAGRLAGRAWFEYMTRISFFAYCGHFLFCSIVLHVSAPLFAGMGVGKRTVLSMVFLLGVPLMALVHKAASKVSGRALKIFDGTL